MGRAYGPHFYFAASFQRVMPKASLWENPLLQYGTGATPLHFNTNALLFFSQLIEP